MATYYNPAAAINTCKRKKICASGDLYECAVRLAPRDAPEG